MGPLTRVLAGGQPTQRQSLGLGGLESEVLMQEYWTQPATYDPIEFDTRFRPELLDVWLPHFVRLADLAAAQRVLDLGCGTGGFARAMAQHTQAQVIGVDVYAMPSHALVLCRSCGHWAMRRPYLWPTRQLTGSSCH